MKVVCCSGNRDGCINKVNLQVGIPPQYVTRHPGQLSLLPIAGWEMSTWTKCDDALWLGNKGRMAHSIRG